MSPSPALIQFWSTDLARDAFLECVPKKDLLSLRQVCHEFSTRTAPFLFSDIKVEFRSSTFTRPARMAALERIGHYIMSLTFSFSHSPETFLAPLLDPLTGAEQSFIYSPQVHTHASTASRLSVPKYGTWEMTDLLTKQYPPLFHAATNIPSFIRAFRAFTSLSHLTISCDGQAPAHRYRRSVVDYALISLRIAIEQAPLKSLTKLSLLPIHPGALLYLRHSTGFGASPSSPRRWSQLRKLDVLMDSFPYGSKHSTDHLKLIHSYLQGFPDLTHFKFRWKGEKGPSPVSLSSEPCLQADSSLGKTWPSLDQPRFKLRPIKFRSLRSMELENVSMDASQISSFILEHRHTVREFNFEETELRTGTWDDALAPLSRLSGNDDWKERQEETMDVPIMLSPPGVEMRQLQKALLSQSRRKDRPKHNKAYSNLHRATWKTRELFGCGPEHMKKLLRTSVFSWR